MRKNILILVALLIGISFIACEETTNPIEEDGTINISSTPAGAQIWLDGDSTGVVTPGSVKAEAGFHDITLKLASYSDLTLSHISVEAGKETLLSDNILVQFGSINIVSEPTGAEIWIGGTNSGEVTPATIGSLESGSYEVTLKLENYFDAAQTIQLTMGQTAQVNIALVPFVEYFSTPVKLYETFGTSATQPSGLDLSTGDAFGTSDGDNNGKIDLYYFSNSAGTTYLVQSAHINSNMSRETFFKVSSASDLQDGTDSPAKDGTWVDNMNDRETNYVFLYDADGHYSKLKIVNFHAGTGSGDPSWVEVAWMYNNTQDDLVF